MRAGGCTVQQALTPEAAAVVKQAVTLARRRGHAQVTPLHVANTMLSSTTGLLRSACLQSHSHPLQCKALELCFNVALNRLPASTASGPMLGSHHYHHHHHYPPSLSNALVAAFKRAQAHQRRGSMDTQQQPLLAVKIELDQLVISILDDPSVSRVMREAGFSSTQVKSNVEQAVSLDICTPTSPNSTSSKPNECSSLKTRPNFDQVRTEDVMSVVDSLLSRRKRSMVVIGECLATTEGVVRGVMDRVDKGEVPEVLKNLQFITLPLYSFRVMSREEVDQKVGELRCFVKSCCVRRGAVLYLGDLKWAAEYRLSCEEKGKSYYCPVEHAIMEIRSMVCSGMGGDRFWLMGIATYKTYMRCRIGNPSLEAVWGLQPLAIPAGSLELSLNFGSASQSQFKSKRSGDGPCWSLLEDGVRNRLNCCADCSVKFENEVRGLPNISGSSNGSTTSSLPTWLRQYKEENQRQTSIKDQERIKHLCKKWNSICHSSHKYHHHPPSEMTIHVSSASPPSFSISSYNQHLPNLPDVPVSIKLPWMEGLCVSETVSESLEPNSGFYIEEHRGQRLPCNPNTNPNSASSSDTMETEHANKFKELNAENLKTLCNAMERRVPWQSDIIPEIASTILQCRSGMVRRKERSRSAKNKEETWLCFLGGDVVGKENIGRELARQIFGSRSSFISIGLSSFSSTRSDSNDELRNKRSRSEASHSYVERFGDAILDSPHRVIVLEDIEQVDSWSQMGIKTAIERGWVHSSSGEEVSMCDVIVILFCESLESRSRACSPPSKQKSDGEEVKDEGGEQNFSSCVCLDLNLSAGGDDMDGCSSDDTGLFESVDRTVVFKLPEH